MPEHQKVQKTSQKIQKHSGKKKEYVEIKYCSSRGDAENQRGNRSNEERFRQLPDKVDKNKMTDVELAVGGERRGSDAWQTGNCCMEELWQQFIALGANRIDAFSKGSKEKWEHFRSRCQEEKKDEGSLKTNKSKVKPVSSWCYQRQPGSMKALQRVLWSLIFLVLGLRMVKAEESGIQAQKMSEKDLYQTPQVDFRWKRVHSWGLVNGDGTREFFAKKEKEKRNSQGKDPSTPEKNSQGKDPRTFDGNSQGKGPKTFDSNLGAVVGAEEGAIE